MKKASKLLKRILIAGILPLLALGSCITDKEIYPRSGEGEAEITFSIMLPGKSAPRSRAMTEGQENEVATMDVLVFEPSGNYVYTARCSGADISTVAGTNYRQKSFTVKLRQGTFDFVLLANAPDLTGISFSGKTKPAALALIEVGGLAGGKWLADGTRPIPMWGEKNNVTIDETTDLTGSNGISLARMVARVDVGVTAAKFQLSSVHVYNYNTKGTIAPQASGWNPGGPDFETNPPKATAPNVPATSTPAKGPISYDNLGGRSEIDEINNRCVTEIYIFEAENHTGAGHTTAKTLLDRTCLVVGGVYDANGDGDFTNDGNPTFYRMDFSTGSTYYDILRNHQYIFSITDVSGPGYEEADIAFASAPANIEGNVLKWNEAEFGEIRFDGQYFLSVSPTVFNLYREEQDISKGHTLTIATDVPVIGGKNWTAKLYEDEAGTTELTDQWFELDKLNDNQVYPAKSTVSLTATENTGSARTGWIFIEAGRIIFKVKVTQSNQEEPQKYEIIITTDNAGYDVEVSELFFTAAGAAPTPQTFNVKWLPSGSQLKATLIPDAYKPLPTSGSTYAPTVSQTPEMLSWDSNGKSYTVSPEAATLSGDFEENSSKVQFELQSPLGVITKTINLRQTTYKLIPQPATILMDGKPQSFLVKANFSWKAEFLSATEDDQPGNSTRIVKSFGVQYGGNNTTTGDPVTFTCNDYITTYDAANPQKGVVTVKFYRLEKNNWVDWSTHDVTCYAAVPVGESNCYMIKNSDPVPILIPVSQVGYAMKAATSGFLGTTWISDFSKLKVQVLWTDLQKGTTGTGEFGTDDAVVKVLAYNGATTVADGKIVVVPGSGTGNAGIILYEDNGTPGYQYKAPPLTASDDKIIWSWHIWKSDYYPYDSDGNADTKVSPNTNGFMNRNLGSMSNAVNSPQTLGLLYQWGRKDPFPGPSKTSGITNGSTAAADSQTFYYSTGTNLFTETGILASTASNLANATNFPNIRYYNTATPYDWFTNTGAKNDDLWGGGAATEFLHPAVNGVRKSVYDPCPEGYRIPRNGNDGWGSVTAWTAATNGSTHATFGGYYPAAGYRFTNQGGFYYVGTYGYYWQATPTGTNGYNLNLNGATANPGNNNNRANGFSVRCRAEFLMTEHDKSFGQGIVARRVPRLFRRKEK